MWASSSRWSFWKAGRMPTWAAGAAAASVKVRRGGPMLPLKKGCWDGPEEVAVSLDGWGIVRGCICRCKGLKRVYGIKLYIDTGIVYIRLY